MPVAMDHMQWLGDTIEEIATEKAGIIKPGATAVIAQQQVAAAEILLERAALVGATVAREGFEFGVISREVAVGGQQLVLQGLRGIYGDVYLPLFGAYQASNAACALAAVEAFAGVSETTVNEDGSTVTLGPGLSTEGLDPDLVRAGFARASSPGRLDILRRSPTVIADAGHNPAGVAATMEALTESFDFDRIIGVVAVMEDKDVEGVLDELEPVLSEIVVTTNSSPRAMPADELAELARDIFGEDRVHVEQRLDDAIEAAVALADEADAELAGEAGGGGGLGSAAVLVTGSVVTAGDAQLLLAPASAVGTSSNAGYAAKRPRRPDRRHRSKETSREAAAGHRPVHGGRRRPARDRPRQAARTRERRDGGRGLRRHRGHRVRALRLCRPGPRRAVGGLGVSGPGHRLRCAAAGDVHPRRDLRGALVHWHLAWPQVGTRRGQARLRRSAPHPVPAPAPVSSGVIQ